MLDSHRVNTGVPERPILLKYSARYCPVAHVPLPDVLVNVALTEKTEFPVSVHGAVPVHPPPLQPSKREPDAGVAESVTTAPPAKSSVQSLPQLMPVGALATVPLPVPDLVTVISSVLMLVVRHASLEYPEDPAALSARTR